MGGARDWEENTESEEILNSSWEKIFTEPLATEAVCIVFVNRQTGEVSERWIQTLDTIIDKDRFDKFFEKALAGYLEIQHYEIEEEASKILE